MTPIVDSVWIQPGFSSREVVKTIDGCQKLGVKYEWAKPIPSTAAIVGEIDFCERHLGFCPRPDFYPDFLQEYFKRPILRSVDARTLRGEWFIKSAERYKSFPARIILDGHPLPAERVDASGLVKFTQEWRYYISDGLVLATGWYDGHDANELAPSLQVNWPLGFCGAVDFGRLESGEIALVECHHPFSCGWYGEDSVAYVRWVISGWQAILNHARTSEPASAF